MQLHACGVTKYRLNEWSSIRQALPPGVSVLPLDVALGHMLAHAVSSSEEEWSSWAGQVWVPADLPA